MPFDATVAGASATSYLTVEAANALAASDLGPEAAQWLAVATTTAMKQAALERATREIDSWLRTGWQPYLAVQALMFPRLIDQGAAGAFVPRNVLRATYEQATYVLANAQVLDRASSRRARDLQAAAEPNLSYSQAQPGDPPTTLSPAALGYLTGYRTAGTRRGIRSVRMASGYMP